MICLSVQIPSVQIPPRPGSTPTHPSPHLCVARVRLAHAARARASTSRARTHTGGRNCACAACGLTAPRPVASSPLPVSGHAPGTAVVLRKEAHTAYVMHTSGAKRLWLMLTKSWLGCAAHAWLGIACTDDQNVALGMPKGNTKQAGHAGAAASHAIHALCSKPWRTCALQQRHATTPCNTCRCMHTCRS